MKLFHQNTPCRPEFPFAAGVICGCAGGTLLPFLPAGIICAFLFSRKAGLCFLAGLLCGGAALLIQTCSLRSALAELPERNSRITLVCRAADSRISHAANMPRPGFFIAEICQINGRRSRKGTKIAVYPPKEAPLPRYGEIFSGTGQLSGPEGSFGRFLEARNILRLWQPDDLKQEKAAAGMMYQLLRCRDHLLERCLEGISSQRAKVIAGTMFFGTSGGFDPEMRRAYINSGTLHLFSISGMHLAAIAMILMNALRLLPGNTGLLLSVLLLTVYALTTGANPPVMRALIVILFWAAGKLLLLKKDNFDLLSLAAALLFLCDPALIGDTGIWYSLFITAILILSGKRIRETAAEGCGLLQALPDAPESRSLLRSLYRKWQGVSLLLVCLAAFAAGIGISAVNGNLIVPGSVFINLVLLFFIPLLFGVAGVKLISGPLFPPGVFEKFLLFLDAFCTEGGKLFSPLTPSLPPLLEGILFCLLLLAAAGLRSSKLRRAAFLLAGTLCLIWLVRPGLRPPSAAVISGEYGTLPVIVICEPREGISFVVNASDRALTEKAVEILLKNGIRFPEALLFSKNTADTLPALPLLMENTPPRRVRLPDGNVNVLMKKLAESGVKNPASGDREREFLQIFQEKNKTRLEYFDPGSKLSFRMEWSDTVPGREISVNGRDVYRIPWGNKPEVVIHEFVR